MICAGGGGAGFCSFGGGTSGDPVGGVCVPADAAQRHAEQLLLARPRVDSPVRRRHKRATQGPVVATRVRRATHHASEAQLSLLAERARHGWLLLVGSLRRGFDRAIT